MDPVQREQRMQTVCLFILSTVAIATALLWLRPVMIPFVLAIFMAFGLTPLIDLQMRYFRVPRPLAMLATLLFGFVVLGLVGGMVSTSVGQLAANAESYEAQIKHLIGNLAAALPLERLGVHIETANLVQRSLKIVGVMLVVSPNRVVGRTGRRRLLQLQRSHEPPRCRQR